MSSAEYAYGIQPETRLVHAFTRSPNGRAWMSWCGTQVVITWTRWERAPDDATPTCLCCAMNGPR